MTLTKWAMAAMMMLAANISAEADQDINPVTFEASPSIAGGEEVVLPQLSELLGGPVDEFGALISVPADGTDTIGEQIIDYAKRFIGTRYRRGSKGPKAFDCSGFTSYVFRNFDLSLNASSRTQATQGERIDLTDARPGDLVFFAGRRGGSSVGHVGIVIAADPETGSIDFIHAATSRGVRIDSYPDGGYYSRRFHSIRRIINS